MSKVLQLSIFCLMLCLSACATNSTTPDASQLSSTEALILGQDYSVLGSILSPLGTKKRTQIVKLNGVSVSKENSYSLKVPQGKHKLNLICLVVFDRNIRISNSFELGITTEGGKVYQLDANATRDRRCAVEIRQ